MSNKNYLNLEITWTRTSDAEFPYEAALDGENLLIRINDFPDEVLYTLLVNGSEEISFNDWSKSWKRPGKERRMFYSESVAH